MKRRTREVAPGQRYRKAGARGKIWEVVAIHTDASGAVHARMRSAEDGETYRTLAIGVLTDPKSFQPIEDK